MTLMEWTDNFSVGVSALDQEHMLLIDSINHLDEAVRVSIRNPEIPEILTSLVELTTNLFRDEETLMRQTGFAGLEGHQEVHQKLLRAVAEILDKVKSGKLSASANLAAFLHFWLEKHIEEHDQQYAQHVASLKPASAAK